MGRLIAGLLMLYVAVGSDVTGKWSGTLEIVNPEGESRTRPAVLILKQDGNNVTGTGGPSEDEQFPIKNGLLDGEKLTFQAEGESGTMYFELRVSGDEITGQVRRGNDSSRGAELKVRRLAQQ